MQIGCTHLSPEERERRILSRACLYCCQTGHFLSGCPSCPGKGAGSPVTWGILVSRALDPSDSRPLLCATLLWQDQTSPLTILLDSGADESFIDLKLVHQLGINTVPLDSPFPRGTDPGTRRKATRSGGASYRACQPASFG